MNNLPSQQTEPVWEFRGEYRFLSNFFMLLMPLYEWTDSGWIVYFSVEHAYQAAKSQDPNVRFRVSALPRPLDAKRQGKKIRLRPDWEEVKDNIMEYYLRQKFQQQDMAKRLRDTHPRPLYHGNHHGDRYWGRDLRTGEGEDRLGQLLMQIRNEQIAYR